MNYKEMYGEEPAKWITWRGMHIPVNKDGKLLKLKVTREDYKNSKKKEQHQAMEKDVKENLNVYAKGAVKRNIDKNDFANNASKYNIPPDESTKAYDKALKDRINLYKKRKGYNKNIEQR